SLSWVPSWPVPPVGGCCEPEAPGEVAGAVAPVVVPVLGGGLQGLRDGGQPLTPGLVGGVKAGLVPHPPVPASGLVLVHDLVVPVVVVVRVHVVRLRDADVDL